MTNMLSPVPSCIIHIEFNLIIFLELILFEFAVTSVKSNILAAKLTPPSQPSSNSPQPASGLIQQTTAPFNTILKEQLLQRQPDITARPLTSQPDITARPLSRPPSSTIVQDLLQEEIVPGTSTPPQTPPPPSMQQQSITQSSTTVTHSVSTAKQNTVEQLGADFPTKPPQAPQQSGIESNSIESQGLQVAVAPVHAQHSMPAQESSHHPCLPVNRPPSRRRSGSPHSSPPRSASPKSQFQKQPKSPKSPRSRSPRSSSPKGSFKFELQNQSAIEINCDSSHAQMEILSGDTLTEKSQDNNSVKVNGGKAQNGSCTGVDMVSSRTNDESHTRTDGSFINGDVLSPAPSDSSSSPSHLPQVSPKKNGANTSPSILEKRAKLAQLLQDTAGFKEALGLGQNGVVINHIGNGDNLDTNQKDSGCIEQNELTGTDGLSSQTGKNGCDDNSLGNSTDGANDSLQEDQDQNNKKSSASMDTNSAEQQNQAADNSVIADLSENQGSEAANSKSLETKKEASMSSREMPVPSSYDEELEQAVLSIEPGYDDVASDSPADSPSASNAPTPVSFMQDRPGTSALAELLHRKQMNSASNGSGTAVVMAESATPDQASQTVSTSQNSPSHHPSPLMQQLQQRLQRPAQTFVQRGQSQMLTNRMPQPNTQAVTGQQTGQVTLPITVPSAQQNTAAILNTSQSVVITQASNVQGSGAGFTTSHSVVQQQLLQRLRAPHPHSTPTTNTQQASMGALPQSQLTVTCAQPQQLSAFQHDKGSDSELSKGEVSSVVSQTISTSSSRPPSAGPHVHTPLPSPGGSESRTPPPPPASPSLSTGTPARRLSTTSTASSEGSKPKKRKRGSRSSSIDSNATIITNEIQFMCEWDGCGQ